MNIISSQKLTHIRSFKFIFRNVPRVQVLTTFIDLMSNKSDYSAFLLLNLLLMCLSGRLSSRMPRTNICCRSQDLEGPAPGLSPLIIALCSMICSLSKTRSIASKRVRPSTMPCNLLALHIHVPEQNIQIMRLKVLDVRKYAIFSKGIFPFVKIKC